jgi:tetratricopeptide (TPR) repeat protein
MLRTLFIAGLIGGLAPLPCGGASGQTVLQESREKLGAVSFTNSCSAAVQPTFNRGVALLHSFEFRQAIEAFKDTVKADPACAIAYWGVALSHWSNPFASGIRPRAVLTQAQQTIDAANEAGAKTERERDYIAAVARLFKSADTAPQPTRIAAYRDAMAALAAKYPDDVEASIFYALALAAFADPADKTYANQLEAGAMLERLAARYPDHPGLAHYIIHSYDFPPLASRGLEAARRYSKIAPSAPHALHMPSHTFTRIGYWQESIDANIASAAAARRVGCTAEELHASDYQAYAYLQTAQDRAARKVLDSLPEAAARFDPAAICGAAPGSAGLFALAAIPARYALERGMWADAAKLEPRPTSFPYTDAMTYFARALGAARSGAAAAARAAVQALAPLRDRLAQAGEGYWAEQVEIQRRGATAWLALAEGRKDEALAEMRAAADREDATEKSAVTPGPLVPARELLGEMLLELNQPAQALTEFETALKKEPNRFRTIAGAAKAATAAGNDAAATAYYRQLLKIGARADKHGRPELRDARAFIRARGKPAAERPSRDGLHWAGSLPQGTP